MDYTALVCAILFGLVGIGVTIYLLALFADAAVGDARGFSERLRFKQREKHLKTADELIEKGAFLPAFEALRRAFYFEQLRLERELVDKINNHHISILSRVVIVSEKLSRHIPNLAIIEDLLMTRGELMRSFFEARSSREALLKKRSREVPGWALDEYASKLHELKDKLTTNRRSLESQLDKVLDSLKDIPRESEITYH